MKTVTAIQTAINFYTIIKERKPEARQYSLSFGLILLCSGKILINMKIKNTNFVPCDFGNRHTYKKIIKKILNYADEVVFTITPFLENDDEFKNSRWSELSDSFLYSVYDSAPSDQPKDKHSMIVLKSDFHVYDYFLNLCDFFEIQEDDKYEISMKDPAFMKNGEIFCYTISHEEACDIEEALWEQIMK